MKKAANKTEEVKTEEKRVEENAGMLEKIRHSAAHMLAEAVKEIFPEARLGIGPAIENGFYYDFELEHKFTPDDLKKIEERMKEITKRKEGFERFESTKKKAEELLKNEPYKLELLKEIDKPAFYKNGNFMDLCRGPHISNTSELKAFRLTKTAGAYWKGNSENKQLQRIYGIAFATKEELDNYLKLLEEAEKRDHVLIGKKLDLFSFHPEAPAMPFWHNNGLIIRDELLKYWREVHRREGYQEIETPIILDKQLWIRSGHWDNYKENMYFTKVDNRDFTIKPMNCPGGMLLYNEKLHSYKEFPLKVAELGIVHRHELSGVTHGLFRVRKFTQDDAHIFMTEAQIKDEITDVIKLAAEIYSRFGFTYEVELSTQPEKRIGTDEQWDYSTKELKRALEELKIKYKINEGQGAFYGPKIDFHIKDAINRNWQCGTIQLDMSMPERFEMTYEGKDGKKHRPIMVHRALYGSLERFIGILIEHYAGKFPVWLAPVQTIILTITNEQNEYAEKLAAKMKDAGFRVEADIRSESMGRKVREAQLKLIPYTVTIGNKEIENNEIAVRTLDGKVKTEKTDDFIKRVLKEIKERV